MGFQNLFFDMGREHILDYKHGVDHILFVVALCALFTLRDWRQVLILVTAFTIGHSITLALSVFGVIAVNVEIVEFLITVTIFITAVSNMFRKEDGVSSSFGSINYFYAAFFGLIHGLGFSNYLKSMLTKNQNIVSQLFAFNIGLEFGQIIIVVLFLVYCFIMVDLFGVNRRDWRLVISSVVALIALHLMNETAFW
jgi:hypothetical protein